MSCHVTGQFLCKVCWSLDFSHQGLVVTHVVIIITVIILTWANSFSGIVSVPPEDTVIATSDIIVAALVGNEITVSPLNSWG